MYYERVGRVDLQRSERLLVMLVLVQPRAFQV